MARSQQTVTATADQPVRCRSADRLGRTQFASAIADALLKWNVPESLVVSIMGSWGAGKTSLKNFVVEAISQTDDDRRPDVLEFNPWQITDRTAMASAFFRDVGLKLGRRDRAQRNVQTERRWTRWAAGLEVTSSLIDLFPYRISVSALVVGFTALVLSRTQSTSSSWLFWLGVVATTGAALITTSAKAARAVAVAYREIAGTYSLTIDELRQELKDDLAKRRRSLLIVIDDIDRLPATDIRVIFQLVRAVSDFPQLLFLLIFERATVEHALSEPGLTSGDEYLEKIVQMPFFLPQIDQLRLREILIEEINVALAELPPNVRFDERRWWNLFAGGIEGYIEDLRDVYRFITGFRFHAGLLCSNNVLEVNPVDLLGVEALRLFDPALYVALPDHKNLLLHGPGQSRSGPDNHDSVKAELNELLSLTRRPVAARRILSILFQQVQRLTNPNTYTQSYESDLQLNLRICSPEVVDRYFVLAIPSNDISTAEIRRLIDESNNPAVFEHHLRELQQRGQLLLAIDRLGPHEDDIPVSALPGVVLALFNTGDALPERAPVNGFPAVWLFEGFIVRLLHRIENEQDRVQVVHNALANTSALYVPTFLVTVESTPHSNTESPPLLLRESWPPLKELWLEKLTSAAASGELAKQSHFGRLLYGWAELAPDDRVSRWSQEFTSTSARALCILNALATRVQSYGLGDASSQTHLEVKLDEVAKFIPIEYLAAKLASVNQNELSREDDETLKAFRRALQTRAESSPRFIS